MMDGRGDALPRAEEVRALVQLGKLALDERQDATRVVEVVLWRRDPCVVVGAMVVHVGTVAENGIIGCWPSLGSHSRRAKPKHATRDVQAVSDTFDDADVLDHALAGDHLGHTAGGQSQRRAIREGRCQHAP